MASRGLTTAKLTAAIVSAVTVLGGGVGGYQVLAARQASSEKALEQLIEHHENDIKSALAEITAMRDKLDAVSSTSSMSAGKLDTLIGMIRDHLQQETRS